MDIRRNVTICNIHDGHRMASMGGLNVHVRCTLSWAVQQMRNSWFLGFLSGTNTSTEFGIAIQTMWRGRRCSYTVNIVDAMRVFWPRRNIIRTLIFVGAFCCCCCCNILFVYLLAIPSVCLFVSSVWHGILAQWNRALALLCWYLTAYTFYVLLFFSSFICSVYMAVFSVHCTNVHIPLFIVPPSLTDWFYVRCTNVFSFARILFSIVFVKYYCGSTTCVHSPVRFPNHLFAWNPGHETNTKSNKHKRHV